MQYFAYGSNMVLEQMRRLCGWHFQVLGAGFLEGYELAPDVRGYLTAEPKKGAKVFGIIYKVDQHCLDILDEFEGHPNVYVRTKVQVNDMAGQSYEASVYLELPEFYGGKLVKQDFLQRITSAAEEHRLPQEWIKFLGTFKQA